MIETRLRRKNRESMKTRFYENGSSSSRLYIQDKLKFKKKFSNQVPSNFPKSHDYRVLNPKS